MKVVVDSVRLVRLLELAGTAKNYIADVGLTVRGRIPRFAYALEAAKRRVEQSAEKMEPERRRLRRYERALRKIVNDGVGRCVCIESEPPHPRCAGTLCVARRALREGSDGA